jgi:hypothetical protein
MVRDRLARRNSYGIKQPFAELKRIVEESGVDADTPFSVTEKLLEPRSGEILRWIYGEIVKECRTRGVVPVLVYQPLTYEAEPGAGGEGEEFVVRLAIESGFVVLNIKDAYLGHSRDELRVRPWDGHPGPFAHALLEERLYEELMKAEKELHLGLALETGQGD